MGIVRARLQGRLGALITLIKSRFEHHVADRIAAQPDERISRLAIWALGDSVWLDREWRRPGELNVIVPTDHVGAVSNPHAVAMARRFLGGGEIAEDDLTWRVVMVNVLRYAFEPWRPG